MFTVTPLSRNNWNMKEIIAKIQISNVPSTPLHAKLKAKEFVYERNYMEFAKQVCDFKVRESDIWLIGFPKSGTTWAQEMTWLIGNDFDFEAAKSKDINYRMPIIEQATFERAEGLTLQTITEAESPRVIKSHLPAELLPTNYWRVKPKTIFVARNVKDTIVSYYNHLKMIGVRTSIGNVVDLFLNDEVRCSPYWENVLDFWQLRNEEHILFLRYEEMKKDLPGVIKKCCNFLGKSCSSENLGKLTEHLSFDNMKNNPRIVDEILIGKYKFTDDDGNVIKFIRKGTIGEHKEMLSKEEIRNIDLWSAKKLEGFDYPYEL